jgi:acyl-CoA synthetase (AMP-forming)/AMP-acid ligase II
MNLGMLLEMAADAAPRRVAVGPRSSGFTYDAMLGRARSLAGHLRDGGYERLGLVALNSEALPLCLFGAGLAGVPFAPLNYRLPEDSLRSLAQRLAPALIVVDPGREPLLKGIDGIDVLTTDELLELTATQRDADLPFVDTEDVAVLLFTSGTTGEPKAAVLRHRHLTSYILSSVEFLGAGETETQLVCVPGYHIAGISSILSSVFSGRRIAYLPAFEPASWVQVARAEEVTQAMVVPTMLGRILDVLDAGGPPLTQLRHLSYGGGRMPLEVIERAMAALPGVRFVNAYGLTVTSSTISVLGPDDHVEAAASDDPVARARLASVGRPLPDVEVQIRDAGGTPVPVGTVGEVCVRGDQIAGEYLGRSVLTEDGWFPTRDAGRLDEHGFLFLEGRLDDVIVRGAENLSPGEIEDCLMAHPAVAEAAVVGVPDAEWGETVAAAVVLVREANATPEALKDWVRARLRSTKTPTRLEIRAELPYNETGKLLRRVLRDELARPRGESLPASVR